MTKSPNAYLDSTTMDKFHQPVLVNQVLDYLAVAPGKKFIDATIGGGGHSQAIIEKGATVLGIDVDPEAVSFAQQRLHPTHAQVVQGNFTELNTLAQTHGFKQVDGILFDLGVGSYQLDNPQRGFSFQADAPLDMRLDPSLSVTAADLVNGLGRKELYLLFTKLAQEKLAGAIASAIVQSRRLRPITTTGQLSQLVEQVYGYRGKLHPATKVFLALRLAVNDELNNLKAVLPDAMELLKPAGRLVVISFHEGEDRIVKHFFRAQALKLQAEVLTKKPIIPSISEINLNPRSRSAKLRALKKL